MGPSCKGNNKILTHDIYILIRGQILCFYVYFYWIFTQRLWFFLFPLLIKTLTFRNIAFPKFINVVRTKTIIQDFDSQDAKSIFPWIPLCHLAVLWTNISCGLPRMRVVVPYFWDNIKKHILARGDNLISMTGLYRWYAQLFEWGMYESQESQKYGVKFVQRSCERK